MGNTPNNNFPYPESTDLVKDGAQNIEDLAAAIDTTLGVYSASTSMGVHLSTVTFSGVSSFSLPASTFTSTYDRYLILIDSVHSATTTDVNFRMRLSGTDNSATEYSTQIVNAETTNVTAARTSKATSTVVARTSAGRAINQFLVFNPAAAVFTQMIAETSFYTNLAVAKYAALHEVATAFDSMSFIISTGTFTGSCSVYGFNK